MCIVLLRAEKQRYCTEIVARNGKDGNGLKLGKRPVFFKF